jgi:hypothetical protein
MLGNLNRNIALSLPKHLEDPTSSPGLEDMEEVYCDALGLIYPIIAFLFLLTRIQ